MPTRAQGCAAVPSVDAHGQLVSITDRADAQRLMSYDADGRLSRVDAGSETISFTYDAAGRPLTLTDGDGVTRYGYDALGRMASE